MRLIFTSLCLMFLWITPHVYGQNDSLSAKKRKSTIVKTNPSYFLQLSGIVKELQQFEKAKELELDSVTIAVYDSTRNVVAKVLYANKKNANIKLKLNQVYTVKISKDGFVSKFFEVNTKVPKGKIRTFNFMFEVFLFKEVDDVDYTLLQKPVAIIEYQVNTQKFDYNYEYTNQVNKELQNQYKELFYLKKE